MTGNGHSPGWGPDDDPFPETPPPNGHDHGPSRWGQHPWIHPEEPLLPIDLATVEIPDYDRGWLIPGWIPLYETTGLGGPGGEGKTLLAHMLATAAALHGCWLNLPVKQMKSALVLCEDRQNDTLWRQRDINTRLHNNLAISHLAPWLRLFPRRDSKHNYLAHFDRDGELHETVFFIQLLAELKKFASGQPLLTVLDTRADVFRGNQNDEHHARLFIRRICDQIARETSGAVILIYQPSLTGISQGTGTSGSVQWDAAFRARLYLESIDAKNPGKRRVTLLKANYAEKDKQIDIEWQKGVFVTEQEIDAGKTDYERLAERAKDERIFLFLLNKFTTQNRDVSASPASQNYAPRLFNPEKASEKIGEDALASAMNSLIDKTAIIIETTKRGAKRLVKSPPAQDNP